MHGSIYEAGAATAVRDWLKRGGVQVLFIEPGSPRENGRNGSFNGRLRDQHLNGESFTHCARPRSCWSDGAGTTTTSVRTARSATDHPHPQLRCVEGQASLRLTLQAARSVRELDRARHTRLTTFRSAGTIPPIVHPVHPIPLLLAAISGWVHREQADAIAYLIEENPGRFTMMRLDFI